MTRMGRTEFLSLPTALMACGPFASFAQFAAQIFACGYAALCDNHRESPRFAAGGSVYLP